MKIKLFTFIILLSAFNDCQSQIWTQLTNVSGNNRNAASGFSIGNFGYIGVGFNGTSMLQDFWKYDPATNAWTQVASFIGPGRFGAVSFSIGTKGYCGIGSTGYPIYNFVTDFYEYNSLTNTWTQLGNFPGPGRYTVASFVLNNKGYMGTGWSPYYDDFWEYDPITDTWVQKATFPGGPRQSAVGFSINNKGYMGGGYGGVYYSDFYEYNAINDTWTPIANLPGTSRYGSVSFTIGADAYVGTGGSASSYFNDFYRYDSGANNWLPILNYPGSGVRHAPSFSIGNCGYFGTGVSATGITNTFWRYCPCSTVVDCSGPTHACTGDSVSFSNNSVNATSYLWIFGDGDTSVSSANSVKHNYLNTGNFQVKLVGYSACGNDTDVLNLVVTNIDANIVYSDVSCFGAHNGSAAVTNPYPGQTYNWTPGPFNTSSISNLIAGNYVLNIIDSFGCQGSYSININEPLPLSVNIVSQNSGCTGGGSASASVSGGTTPYQYSWNTFPVSLSSSVYGLDTGTFILQVTDSNGCVKSDSVKILLDSSFTAQVISQNASCLANDGNISVFVNGGSGNFSYDWTPNISVTNTASNISAGVYSVIVTDQTTGCFKTITAIVNGSLSLHAQIQNAVNVTCENDQNGQAAVLVTGGALPYSYSWTPGNQTTPTAINLEKGFYTVRVEDYDGCPVFDTVTIGYNFPAPTVDLGSDTILCNGDSISLNAGQGFFSYQWSTGSIAQVLSVTTPGFYSVLVTNQYGCEGSDIIHVTFSNCNLFSSVSQANLNELLGVKIFPNPTFNEICITKEAPDKFKASIFIYDPLGRMIYNFQIKNSEKVETCISLREFSEGLYTVKVAGETKSLFFKVIKLSH